MKYTAYKNTKISSPLSKLVCPACKIPFYSIYPTKKYCSSKCRGRVQGTSSNQRKVLKAGKCECCGFSAVLALEAHHHQFRKKIVLCGNCHRIWHKLSEQKYSTKAHLIEVVQECLLEHQYNK